MGHKRQFKRLLGASFPPKAQKTFIICVLFTPSPDGYTHLAISKNTDYDFLSLIPALYVLPQKTLDITSYLSCTKIPLNQTRVLLKTQTQGEDSSPEFIQGIHNPVIGQTPLTGIS